VSWRSTVPFGSDQEVMGEPADDILPKRGESNEFDAHPAYVTIPSCETEMSVQFESEHTSCKNKRTAVAVKAVMNAVEKLTETEATPLSP
jgi:hypothetical protein